METGLLLINFPAQCSSDLSQRFNKKTGVNIRCDDNAMQHNLSLATQTADSPVIEYQIPDAD